ncbi:hypothetical protein FQR65_LT09622 [Abscondita terminalis]|nr:hypothetical protein FQR65_LT09622 [Abscondita terminalis]
MEELMVQQDIEENETEDEILHDPFCDPNKPHKISFEDISSAAYKIKAGVVRTPCDRSQLSDAIGMDVYFKKDYLQYTGSFKERGARYALLMLEDAKKKAGVISASLGNHALALSYHGYKLGIPVTVVMPVVAPIMKISQCKKFNANVIVQGKGMGEAKKVALRLAKHHNYTYINGYDHPHIMAGQGTLGLEIVEQGVESERCPSFSRAIEANKPVYVEIESTLSDGLAVPMVGYNAFETARPLIDKLVVVQEEWIAIAILRLIEYEKCVVEGAGAVGLAAVLAGQLNELQGKRVVLNLCGGNIDTTILGRCLERGLAADGRLVKIVATVSDRPGGIAEFCKLLAGFGVSIKDILHERAWVVSDVFSVEITVLCETRDADHTKALHELLLKNYKKVKFANFSKAHPDINMCGND